MEDPGSLVQIGFSAGARSAPKFDWVRNITSRKLPAHVIDDMDHRSSSAFALFWNLCRSSLPEEVMEDFDNFFEDCCLPRMHPCNGAAGDPINHSQCMAGDYSIQIGDNKFVLKMLKEPLLLGFVDKIIHGLLLNLMSCKWLNILLQIHSFRAPAPSICNIMDGEEGSPTR